MLDLHIIQLSSGQYMSIVVWLHGEKREERTHIDSDESAARNWAKRNTVRLMTDYFTRYRNQRKKALSHLNSIDIYNTFTRLEGLAGKIKDNSKLGELLRLLQAYKVDIESVMDKPDASVYACHRQGWDDIWKLADHAINQTKAA